MTQEACFNGVNGETIALKSVHLNGTLEGLLLNMKIQQRYRNNTGRTLETVYTFPLAWGATLLGMNVEIAGKRLQATVIEKKIAVEKFEQAIEDGDTPVMVERSALGLYTANLGNLKDREEVTIEIEYAQLLRFEQGQIRLCIPTVIAPRFGDPHQYGGLALHETAAVNPMTEYPFTLRLELLGPIAAAKLASPSHMIRMTAIEQGLAVLLERGGMLDRDFIMNLDGLTGQSFAVAAPDGEHTRVLASFCPTFPEQDDAALMMKILVDCSGSMQGDSIESARSAIHNILQELNPVDLISYSRFGDGVRHDLKTLQPCTLATVQRVAAAISMTAADMGGTQLKEALLATFRDIKTPDTMPLKPSVLLITDGDIWDIEAVLKASAKSGQRVFAIGVGSSPAESLLRELAEGTGGACELISPNEDMSAAIVRMFRRMRGTQAAQLKVDWHCNPDWQSPLPAYIYDGETVHLFARFTETPSQTPELIWKSNDQTLCSRPEAIRQTQDTTLTRLGAARQMATATIPDEALALALKYQLVSEQTNLFLVHIRAEDDKAIGLPALQQIEQMQAAGHGGYGSVVPPFMRIPGTGKQLHDPGDLVCYSLDPFTPPQFSPTRASTVISASSARMEMLDIPPFLRDAGKDAFDIPPFLKQSDTEVFRPTPEILIMAFNSAAIKAQDFQEAIEIVISLVENKMGVMLVATVMNDTINHEQGWALLLNWIAAKLKGKIALERHAQRMLKAQIAAIDEAVRTAAQKKIEELLSTYGLDNWV